MGWRQLGMFKLRNRGQRKNKNVFFLSKKEKQGEMKLVESLQGQADKFGINLISNRELYHILKWEGSMLKYGL